MAGKGTRTNKEVPKQFLKVSQDKYLFEISLDKFIRTGLHGRILVNTHKTYKNNIEDFQILR